MGGIPYAEDHFPAIEVIAGSGGMQGIDKDESRLSQLE